MERKLGAIILAAGKGKRMQSKDINKVTFLLKNKPIITHILDVLERMYIAAIVVVVGHAKESVMQAITNHNVTFAEQTEQLGTADAAFAGLKKIPATIDDVYIMNGDDSFFYSDELLTKLSTKHFKSNASVTILTIQVENPQGLGRIVRNGSGEVVAIIEEKDAAENVRRTNEINPACYIFKAAFLRKYLPMIKKSSVTGEYYLTSLIDIAIKYNEKIGTVQAGFIPWRGVNTKEELAEAERLLNN